MYTHDDLSRLQAQSLKLQGWIRQQTFSPEMEKTLRRFSSWEVSELIFRINQSTFRGKLAADPSLPAGEVEPDGRQRWFSLQEINELRRRLKINKRSLMPHRPAGKRAVRAAVANFKGGAGKSTVALHFAHAAALDGYRVLVVDFDPQATLSHSMGLTDVSEEHTVWGIIARDLIRETERMNSGPVGAESGVGLPRRQLPPSITGLGLGDLRITDFIKPTSWPTIDAIPSCANAAFVEFASAQYRHLNPDWTFFAAVSRYLDQIPDDSYDLILFDCPPAIGYQSMNAVFAADVLYVPSGPGYWEYDSTTSFIGQLSEALADLAEGFDLVFDATGNAKAIEAGFPLVAHGGSTVLVSVVKESITFADAEFHKRESRIIGSRNALKEDFDRVMAAIRSGAVPTEAIASAIVPLKDLPARFAKLAHDRDHLIKVIVTP